MQGQKIIKKTFTAFIKLVLYLCLFGAVAIISYKVTKYFDGDQNKTLIDNGTSTTEIVKASADPIAQNLVLGVNEDTAEVESIVLEIFNTNTGNIDLVTIPSDTRVTMSQELYATLLDVNANIPQIITLSNIGKYFDQSVAYEYGTLILNEYLNTTISFYSATVMDDFNKYFTTTATGAYTLNEDIRTKANEATTEHEELELLIGYYENVQSNLLLSERKTYIPSYLEANYDYIHTYLLEESYVDGNYVLDSTDSALIASITSIDTPYTNTQSIVETSSSSKEHSIQILNGTGSAGLAASYQTILENDGYTISEIGNYEGIAQETTRIIVSEEALGADLVEYFNDPTIEVGTVDGGYDILIILGSKDA